MHKPISGPHQRTFIHVQALTNAVIAVVAQALGIGHGHEKEVQRQGRVIAQLDIVMAHKALVNPAELEREVPDPVGTNQSFVGHAHLLLPGLDR